METVILDRRKDVTFFTKAVKYGGSKMIKVSDVMKLLDYDEEEEILRVHIDVVPKEMAETRKSQ